MTASVFCFFFKYDFLISYDRFHFPERDFVHLYYFDPVKNKIVNLLILCKLLWKPGFIRILFFKIPTLKVVLEEYHNEHVEKVAKN